MNIKVIQKKSPNFDKRPQGIKINSIIIHYTGMKTFNQAYKRLSDKKDRKSTRLNSSHKPTSYAVFCLKKKK